MPFYSFEMILVGIILLSAMAVGGMRLWYKRKKEIQNGFDTEEDLKKQKHFDLSEENR